MRRYTNLMQPRWAEGFCSSKASHAFLLQTDLLTIWWWRHATLTLIVAERRIFNTSVNKIRTKSTYLIRCVGSLPLFSYNTTGKFHRCTKHLVLQQLFQRESWHEAVWSLNTSSQSWVLSEQGIHTTSMMQGPYPVGVMRDLVWQWWQHD